jgi:hypothetical protein
MFEWDKTSQRLDVAPERVRRLFRCLGDTQVALPGLPSQKSSVYLCGYEDSRGTQVVVVFHLLMSRRLAVYRYDQGPVAPENLHAVLEEGMHFAESLGFLLDDMEIHLLDPSARRERWNALPLVHGGAYGLDQPMVTGESPGGPAPEAPSLEELHERRRFFIEKLGRFLATL